MEMKLDLSKTSLRDVNQKLHNLPIDTNEKVWRLVNPHGEHACAVGPPSPSKCMSTGISAITAPAMNQRATVIIHGQCGVGVAENIMSGEVRREGHRKQRRCRDRTRRPRGDRGATPERAAAFPMKGVDIVVAGSVGAMSRLHGTKRQPGGLRRCRRQPRDLIYEAKLCVRRIGRESARPPRRRK